MELATFQATIAATSVDLDEIGLHYLEHGTEAPSSPRAYSKAKALTTLSHSKERRALGLFPPIYHVSCPQMGYDAGVSGAYIAFPTIRTVLQIELDIGLYSFR